MIPPNVTGGTWTFGPLQFDVGANQFAANLIANILLYAVDANGNYIISPSDTQNRGTVSSNGSVTVTDEYITALVSAAEYKWHENT
jgi:hypothetical protein